ncbi:MAG: TraR/DksA C4-type zinc finger protein [Patescibacteria group bacterium]
MNQEKINYFKGKLEEELKLLEGELQHVGKRNPRVGNDKTDWEGKPAEFDIDSADESEVADKMEEYEENTALVKNLEIKYNEIKAALKKIEAGKYGLCEIGGEPIEEARLEANPAARTCKLHMQ